MLGSFLWVFLVVFGMNIGIAVGAVGMWKSRSDFQGRGKTKGNLVLVFLRFSTARHFHGAPRFSCYFPLLPEAHKQLVLGLLHLTRRRGVAVRLGELVQGLNAQGRLQIALAFR